MANLILKHKYWQSRVRAKLGVDEPYLPDEVLAQPDFIRVAEAHVIERVPDYEQLDGSKRLWLESAVVCACAALACPVLKASLPKEETGPHFEYAVDVDWDKREKELRQERDSFLSQFTQQERIPRFGRTGGRS